MNHPQLSSSSTPSTLQSCYPVSSSSVTRSASKKMSVSQTYFLAHKARAKLSSEAARADHNLRLLVGHANLLDTIMFQLAQAEKQSESWLIQSVRAATKRDERPEWPLQERQERNETEQEWADDADHSDNACDSDDEDIEMADATPTLCRTAAPYTLSDSRAQDTDVIEEDDEASFSRQHSSATLPELDLLSEESSEDENMTPPSPPAVALPVFSKKQDFFEATRHADLDRDAFYDDGFYLPPRETDRQMTAISVC